MRSIKLGHNAIPPEAKKAILAVFDSGQYSPGPKVRQFEEEWARAHKSKHSVFVNSGTDALRIAILAMKEKYGWKDGDEVAVPALTFPATVNIVLQANLKPFFVDVNMNDGLINPDNLKRRIETGHTRLKAMIPVHLFGQQCPNETYQMAQKYGLKILEDSCETVLNPTKGDISCHSTYMAHHVTTGVGGFASTNDKELKELMWSYANHGRREAGDFNFDRIGYSGRATEFEAVLGLAQLDGLKKTINDRRAMFIELLDALGRFDNLQLFNVTDNTCMMFPVALKTGKSGKIRQELTKAGIENRPLMPITNQKCYQNIVREDDFSVAKEFNRKGFYIPCHPRMTKDDVGWIELVFERYLQNK